MHIFPNISRSKGNQAMKFGQLIEYGMRNIFIEKSYTKCVGEIEHISGSIVQSLKQFVSIVC